ncbi:hypothetical protein [Commensalibacter melissae]|uniref:hypothetical protein n=1 Tax=Commensalibacter melissae TaxID=2070537 RepID=UPI0012D99FD0|nr:hypothetical protein [Commensalibacter melissae]MUG78143.1 hypothetical protein [Commensalibacter melissae]
MTFMPSCKFPHNSVNPGNGGKPDNNSARQKKVQIESAVLICLFKKDVNRKASANPKF